ncbi:hypothetical protein OEZ85_007723 [Tetradesmus obliquus]|uniref:Uncharacterized protein n=1 Tax=Tetradesmus obliquus TaxID=3088 RepID=A0ABY8TH25_TETOB|nr:hypothetical protein OEZ85_007723 [Tetradesmus obliquus]
MSFIIDFFSHKAQQTNEAPSQRAKAFEDGLEAAQNNQADTRVYADMNAKPKYRYGHLQMNPFYEQRNKMYPHRKYTRREE